LADSLTAEKCFPKFYVSAVRAGEIGGSLETTLQRLADYLARTVAIRRTISSALVYPIILLVTAGFSVAVILLFVLPQFEPLFAEAGTALPLPTRILIAVGDALRAYGFALALLCLSLGAWLHVRLKTPAFRRKVDASILKLPLFGRLLAGIDVERFCRTLGTLLANGVSLPAALGVTADTLSNRLIADAVRNTALHLREGESLAERLARSGLFPPGTVDLVRIGEETGRLDEMLMRQADSDEQRLKHRIDRILALLVPCLTILLGLVVAGLIASMLVAILSVNDLALQ
jgi:general secretion pathway protein F